MKIVGVGCGPGLLTLEAIGAIRAARRVYGSGRAIGLVREFIPPGCTVERITDFRNLPSGDDTTVILSTGDPMLGGLGYLEGQVVPGISSLQVAAARLRIPLTQVSVVSAHGRDQAAAAGETAAEVARGKVVFLLADPSLDLEALCRILPDRPGIRIALCDDLGYPDERIAVGTPAAPPVPRTGLFSIVVGVFGRDD